MTPLGPLRTPRRGTGAPDGRPRLRPGRPNRGPGPGAPSRGDSAPMEPLCSPRTVEFPVCPSGTVCAVTASARNLRITSPWVERPAPWGFILVRGLHVLYPRGRADRGESRRAKGRLTPETGGTTESEADSPGSCDLRPKGVSAGVPPQKSKVDDTFAVFRWTRSATEGADRLLGSAGLVLGMQRTLAPCRPGVPQWVQSQGCRESLARRKEGECPWASKAAKEGITLQRTGHSFKGLPPHLCLSLHRPQYRQARKDPTAVRACEDKARVDTAGARPWRWGLSIWVALRAAFWPVLEAL